MVAEKEMTAGGTEEECHAVDTEEEHQQDDNEEQKIERHAVNSDEEAKEREAVEKKNEAEEEEEAAVAHRVKAPRTKSCWGMDRRWTHPHDFAAIVIIHNHLNAFDHKHPFKQRTITLIG